MDGRSPALARARLACHCLFLELGDRLALVDTGFGTRDVANPKERLSAFFRFQCGPALREEMTAVAQIRALGFDPHDVRDIVLTHLDFDHAGGLDDFPGATVHLLAREIETAAAQKTWLDRGRFRPEQWDTRPAWHGYDASEGDPWFGFECVRNLVGLADEVLLVPLFGHTLGHAGVAIRHDGGWLLHAGDAYFYHAEMDVTDPRCTPGLRFYQWMMEKDREQRLANQDRLRQLKRAHGGQVEIFCAHDVAEFEHYAGHALEDPPERAEQPAAYGSPAIVTP